MFKKLFLKIEKKLKNKDLKIFTISLLYYTSLYFSINNRTLLILTFIYWFMIYKVSNNFTLSVLLLLIATLPFPKGRALEFILLSKENIPHWALYSIKYFFPIYLSDFFLAILVYLYIRKIFFNKLSGKNNLKNNLLKTFTFPLFVFLLLLIWVTLGVIRNPFPEIGVLSSVQMLRMFFIFGIPILTYKSFSASLIKKTIHSILSIIIALLIFESGWTLLQRINGGPLGKDIEVYLPGTTYGIRSAENPDLLRNTGTFFEPSILGTFLLMQISILLILMVQKNGFSKLKLPALIATILGTTALIFTGSRVLYGILAIILAVFFKLSKKAELLSNLKTIKNLNFKKAIVVLFILIITLVSAFPYITNRLFTLSEAFSKQGTATYRIDMISYSLKIFNQNPVLGLGLNLSPYFLATSFIGEKYAFDPTYPHNLIAQLLVETGLVGSILFLIFTAYILRPLFISKKLNITKGFILASGIYILCAQFYPIFLNHTELSSFFFLYSGISLIEN